MELDGRREDAARHAQTVEVELGGTVDDVADLLPVHQVRALEHGNAREVGEAGVDQVELAVCRDDAGIGVEPRQHRIAVMAGWQRCLERDIATAVLEPVEIHRRRGGRLRLPACR